MAGYSRLMGEDEEATARALREYRAAADPLIAQQGADLQEGNPSARSIKSVIKSTHQFASSLLSLGVLLHT
jgi:hypothetical protein